MSLEHKTLVIIGGTSGIGLATARLAAAHGATVIVGGRDPERLTQAVRDIGANARGFAVDTADPNSVREFYRDIGTFDCLIIAASGGRGAGPFVSLEEDALRSGFEGKFWGQWRAAQAALPYLAKDGSITFITAASARANQAGTSGLAAINGALNAMIGPLAKELAPIRVNAVSPGVIDTPWWDRQAPGMKDTFFTSSASTLPAGRVGTPEDVAEALCLVAGNGYMTGLVIDVDGGLRLGR